MTAKQKNRCKFLVRLSEEERERLNTLIQNGKHAKRGTLAARNQISTTPPAIQTG